MAQHRRPSASTERTSGGIGGGIHLARVISHLDPTLMGSLEVTLLKDQGNVPGDDAQTYIVRYASPFFGYTGFEYMGKNTGETSTSDGFNDTQKSYGMWMVPPDVGVNVLVLFVNGDPAQGYWFACVPAKFVNQMVPAIAGSTEVYQDIESQQKYGTKQPIPTAEYNKKINGDKQEINPDKIKKPVHPIADAFLKQGLLDDDVRGTTTSSARREVPSAVFGISTPGPLDRGENAKKAFLGKKDSKTETPVPVSRLGGTQFVMDDGDDRYRRAEAASDGPMKYVDVLNQTYVGSTEKTIDPGKSNIPYNEYFRIRTRTGHQILMHNSEDLIYISNARGTTWIEMTSNGKIDIYAKDSVSVHTQQDFNLFADRDINMEAGRNINMKSSQRFHVDVGTDYELAVNANGKITLGANLDLLIGGESKISSKGDMNIATSGKAKYTSAGETHIAGVGGIYESGAEIHMNGKLAETANVAQQVVPLPTHENPATQVEAGWANRYQALPVSSIMTRIPMHEPWPLHENQSPAQLKPATTDREGPAPAATGASTTPATAPEREKEAMAFFISKGWTQVQAAGIVGNLVNESKLNPTATAKNDAGPGKDSIGIAQWNTGRLDNLRNYANDKGTPYTDFQTQLEFVHIELNGAEKGVGKKLKAATTVEEATIAMTKYERFKGYEQGAASPETQKRIASATSINTSYA